MDLFYTVLVLIFIGVMAGFILEWLIHGKDDDNAPD